MAIAMSGPQCITGALAASNRLDKALAEATDLSRERIKAYPRPPRSISNLRTFR